MDNSDIKKIPVDAANDSLNFIVAGFSFASALAWMDVVRWFISSFVNIKSNSGFHYVGTALLTTLLTVFIFMILTKTGIKFTKTQPVYAVTRG
jgi:hypothetical protein